MDRPGSHRARATRGVPQRPAERHPGTRTRLALLGLSVFGLLTGGASWAGGGDLPVMGRLGTEGNALRVAASGGIVYLVSAALEIVDVSDPAAPRRVGRYVPAQSALEVALSGNHAYLLLPDGIEAIDISAPEDPQRAGSQAVQLGIGGLVVAEDRLYATAWNEGLHILDVSDPANMVPLGAFEETPRYSSESAVSGNHAFMTVGPAGLWVFDVSEPANPQHVGSIDEGMENAFPVALAGQLAYVGDGSSLQVIDLRDPVNPQRVGGCPLDGFANDVAVSGDFAYVAAQGAGLVVIDISDPTNPKRVAENSSFTAFGVAVDGDKVYVAATADGLMIFDAFPLPRVSARMPQTPGERLTLTVSGRPGTKVQLQKSNDLRHWEDFHELTLGDDPTDVEETEADLPSHRFYRAVKE